MKKITQIIVLFTTFVFVPGASLAATVTLQNDTNGYTGTSDADLNSYSTSANTGSATTLRVGSYKTLKSVFKFDLSSIPTGSVINSATLSLYVESSPNNGGGDTVSLHRVLTSWDESTVNWSILGANSNISSSAESSPNVGYLPANVWINFPITSLVSGWVNGTVQNNGVILQTGNGPQVITVSSEHSSISLRPKLAIDYTPPSSAPASTPTPAPTLSVSATPTTVAYGGTSAVSWSSTNATTCSATDGSQSQSVPTSGSYPSPALTSSATYTLTCTGAGGNVSKSISISVTPQQTGDTTPPSTPTILSATGDSTSQITLSWSPSTDNVGVTGYKVYRGGVVIATLGNVTTYQNTGLTAATTYTYTVQALDLAGNQSPQSTSITGTTKSVTTTPTPTPTPVNGVCGSSNNQTFSTAPTSNLCSSGTSTPVSGSGPWTWSCTGSNGGASPSCSAQKTAVVTPPPTNTKGIYYVGINGDDSRDCSVAQNINTPRKTFAKAFECMTTPGSTLYILDGTYPYTMTGLPNGSASGGYTTIAALNEGKVIITGGLSMATTNSYIIFQGLRFHDAKSKVVLGHHLKFFKNEFKGGCPSGNCSNTDIGTNDTNNTADILFEDNWWHGQGGRYNVLVYNANRVVIRRAVVRHDGGWDSQGSSNPEAGINLYNTSNSSVENSIIIDSDLNYHEWQGAFYSVANESYSNAASVSANNTWYSNVAIHAQLGGCGYRIDGNRSVSATIQDMYLYNTGEGACLGGAGAVNVNMDRVTVNKASIGFSEWTTNYVGTITNATLIAVPTPTAGNQISYTTGSGAQLKGIGVSGTMHGETGWNAVTGASFLPFPNEARIKKEMCTDAGVTRGFCGASSLSAYVSSYISSTGTTTPTPTPTPVNGVCGSSHNQTFSTVPTTNLCSPNSTPSVVSGSGPWTWSCTGSNGGTSASCSAQKMATPTQDTTPPSIPTALKATAVSSSQINLSWTASTDNVGVTGYKVYRGGVQIATTTTTSYSNTGLSPSTTYTYTTSAFDAKLNTSSQTSGVSTSTMGVTQTPTQSPSTNIGSSIPITPTTSPISPVTSSNPVTTTTGNTGSTVTNNTVTSPTVTTTQAPAPITRQLRLGMANREVIILQTFLIKQGLLPAGNASGYFGNLTLKGLKSFQCTNLSLCSGTVASTGYGATGPATRALINTMSGAR